MWYNKNMKMKKLLFILLIVPLLFVGCCQPESPKNKLYLPATEKVYYYDVNPEGYLAYSTTYTYDDDLLGYTLTRNCYDEEGNGELVCVDVERWEYNQNFTALTYYEKSTEISGENESVSFNRKYTLTYGDHGSYVKTSYEFDETANDYVFYESKAVNYNSKNLIVSQTTTRCDFENDSKTYESDKITYEYNEVDSISIVKYYEDNGSADHKLILIAKDSYDYNNNKVICYSYIWDEDFEDWVEDCHSETSFKTENNITYETEDVYFGENYHNQFIIGKDAFGNIVHDETIYRQPAPAISEAHKSIFEANQNGVLTKYTKSNWDVDEEQYVEEKRVSTTLDNNGLIATCKHEEYNERTSKFKDSILYSYNYNSNKQLVTYTSDEYTSSGTLNRVAKYEYTYTDLVNDKLYSHMETFIPAYMYALDELYQGPDYIF